MSDERDEFHGVGGSYIVDPDTGKRRRVEEPTKDAVPAQTGQRPDDAHPGTQVDSQGLAPAVEKIPTPRRNRIPE